MNLPLTLHQVVDDTKFDQTTEKYAEIGGMAAHRQREGSKIIKKRQ